MSTAVLITLIICGMFLAIMLLQTIEKCSYYKYVLKNRDVFKLVEEREDE